MSDLNTNIFIAACENGDYATVKDLMHEVNVAHRDSLGFRLAAAHGHIDIVKLLWDKSDPITCECYALRHSSAGGHLDIVKLLLFVSDANACSGQAIAFAAIQGHLDVVKVLQPHTNMENIVDALTTAAQHNRTEITEYLLDFVDLRVDPSEALRAAAASSNEKFLDQLIAQASDLLTPQYYIFNDLQKASLSFYEKIVPFCRNHQEEFLRQVALDNFDKIKILEPYVAINHNNSQALYHACCGPDKKLPIIKFLYQHSDPNEVFDWMRKEGASEEDVEFFKMYVAEQTKQIINENLCKEITKVRSNKKM